MRSLNSAAAALLALAGIASISQAQLRPLGPSPRQARTFAGGGVLIAQPVGEFSRYVNVGVGGAATIVHNLDKAGLLSIRGDVMYLVYGHESKRIPWNAQTGRIQLDLDTYNNIFHFSAGPQLNTSYGPLRPYLSAQVGYSYIFTQSSIEGSSNQTPFAQTENYSFGKISYSSAAGTLIPLRTKRIPVALDLGAQYLYNGPSRYLIPGDIQEDDNGGYTTTPHRSHANLLVYRIGVRVGLID
jgi:hypothetical protein